MSIREMNVYDKHGRLVSDGTATTVDFRIYDYPLSGPAPVATRQPSICQVCGGTGEVPWNFYNPHYGTCVSGAAGQQCRTCNGEGAVWPP